jgi:predicted Zn-dependent peptidase
MSGIFMLGMALPAIFPDALVAQRRDISIMSFDRTKVPPPGPPAVLHVPTWSETRLSNGARLIVSEKRTLPLVAISINFNGGADQFESQSTHGIARLTADALSEGTTTRTGDQIADALQLLGTDIGINIGAESGDISSTVLTQHVGAVIDLMADELLHPVFPQVAIDRWKAQTLVQLQQERAETNYLAHNAFARMVYGQYHPYGWVDNDTIIQSLRRDQVIAFHRAYFQPARAIITLVGDIDLATAKRLFEKSLAGWSPAGMPASFMYPAIPTAPPTTIYLVDKPGAAQSSFAIGLPGPPRSTQDYYALRLMNTILGVLFQSRLNRNIREEKGWSYGVRSGFAFGKGPGAFVAGGDIVTAKTDSALVEFLKELRGVQGGRPFTDDELSQGRAALIQSLPEHFASVDAIDGAISSVYLNALPLDYYQRFTERIQSVSADDLLRVAKRYIDMQHLAIVIAGDRATIEAPLRALSIAPIIVLGKE